MKFQINNLCKLPVHSTSQSHQYYTFMLVCPSMLLLKRKNKGLRSMCTQRKIWFMSVFYGRKKFLIVIGSSFIIYWAIRWKRKTRSRPFYFFCHTAGKAGYNVFFVTAFSVWLQFLAVFHTTTYSLHTRIKSLLWVLQKKGTWKLV